jgi:branched-chain amino acid transport system permease protein
MDTHIIGQMAVSGALMGLVYALIAYGFQLTYATSRSLNFGQGELVMVSAFVALSCTNLGLPYGLMVPAALAFGALAGLGVERAAVRLALRQKSEGWIMLTIILGLFLYSAAENLWGRDDHPFPTPISADPIHILGIDVTPLELSVAVGTLGVMALIELFKRRTLLGMVAALAGVLVSPITTVGPTMGAALVLKAFSVAVVAGLDSGFGVVIIGMALGALESLASFYLGSGWREAPGLVLLILALAVRPHGVFGRAEIRKV